MRIATWKQDDPRESSLHDLTREIYDHLDGMGLKE